MYYTLTHRKSEEQWLISQIQSVGEQYNNYTQYCMSLCVCVCVCVCGWV